jgi:hypothetical protein
VAEFLDRVTKRIAELSALQGELQARADKEKALVQSQINALVDIQTALQKDPALEGLYLKALALNLGLQE